MKELNKGKNDGRKLRALSCGDRVTQGVNS